MGINDLIRGYLVERQSTGSTVDPVDSYLAASRVVSTLAEAGVQGLAHPAALVGSVLPFLGTESQSPSYRLQAIVPPAQPGYYPPVASAWTPAPAWADWRPARAYSSLAGPHGRLGAAELQAGLFAFASPDGTFDLRGFSLLGRSLGLTREEAMRAYFRLAGAADAPSVAGLAALAALRADTEGGWDYPAFQELVGDLRGLGRPAGSMLEDLYAALAGSPGPLTQGGLMRGLRLFAPDDLFTPSRFGDLTVALGLEGAAAAAIYGGLPGRSVAALAAFAAQSAGPSGTWTLAEFSAFAARLGGIPAARASLVGGWPLV